MIQLVLGGARSGKSSFAEKLASQKNKSVIYIATATTGDDEMRQRIQHHQKNRPQDWLLIEEPFIISKAISDNSYLNKTIIIECMTLWLTNWLCTNDIDSWLEEKQNFIDAVINCSSDIIIVSNEVGSGIVPLGELTRDFVDQAGWLNQALAEIANQVTLVVAGCPLIIKSAKHP